MLRHHFMHNSDMLSWHGYCTHFVQHGSGPSQFCPCSFLWKDPNTPYWGRRGRWRHLVLCEVVRFVNFYGGNQCGICFVAYIIDMVIHWKFVVYCDTWIFICFCFGYMAMESIIEDLCSFVFDDADSTEHTALFWMKFHLPFPFPRHKLVKVLLEVGCVRCACHHHVHNGFIHKLANSSMNIFWWVI